MTRSGLQAVAVAAMIAAGAVGCGDSEPASTAGPAGSPMSGVPAPAELRPAPEPAVAPVPTVAPAGRVFPVGGAPEGIVADDRTGLVVAALRDPARLVLVEPTSGEVVKTVPTSIARHLQLAGPGGPVLVPGENDDLVSEVALPGGEVTSRTRVGRQPHDAAAYRDLVYVADEFGGTTSVLRAGQVVAKLAGPVQPGGIAVTGDRVGTVDVRAAKLFVYDALAMQSIATLPAGDGPTHVVADDQGRLVVADTRGDALLIYRLLPEPVLETTLPLPGAPYGLAADLERGRLWVALSATNELVRYDVTDGAPREVGRLPTVQQPNSVAVDAGSGTVYVGGMAAGEIQVIEP